MTRRKTEAVGVLLAALGLALVGQHALQAQQKTDKDSLVGTWKIVKAKAAGKDLPEEFTVLSRLTFSRDGKLIFTMLDKNMESKYAWLKAGQLDLALGTVDPSPAIYKFDGDNRLTICAGPPRGTRPTEYTAEKGSEQLLLVLERAKPGQEKPSPQDIAKYKDKIQNAAARAMHTNNFKQIGIAMHNYYGVYKHLPLHAIYSKDGKTPLLSWRVAILPFIEQEDLYREFKLDEPWDSAHNKKLIAKMPKIYAVPGKGKPEDGKTHYQVFTGPGTVFDGNKKRQFQDITDGTSNTILAIEGKNAVVWTKPEDLTLPKDKNQLPAVGGLFKGGIVVLFCDASVHTFRPNPPADLLRTLITRAGNEVVDLEKLEQ